MIRWANSGISSFLSSLSVRVPTKAAIRLPQDVPAITRGKSLASRSAFTTPKWSGRRLVGCKKGARTCLQYPKVAPPLRHSAEDPTLRFALLKNRLFSSNEMLCEVRT